MKSKISIFLFLYFLVSCSSDSVLENKRRDLSHAFNNSGVQQYYLSDLPNWANFSEAGKCFREKSIRFLHLKNLRSSYSLDYEGALQFQIMLNKVFYQVKNGHKEKFLTLKDEERFFYEVSKKVLGGRKDFIKPKFKKINFILIDPIYFGKKPLKNLQNLIRSADFRKAVPIFISFCLSEKKIENWISQNKWDRWNIQVLPPEMFNPFDANGNRRPYYLIELHELFPQYQMKFYSFTKEFPYYVFPKAKKVIFL